MVKLLNDIRNIIESNRAASFIYDTACQNNIYKNFVFNKIDKRIEYIKQTKRYNFLIETSSICNAKCTFCVYASEKRPKIIMSDEIFNLIIERIKQEGITPTIFDLFFLGEPLLDPKLFRRISILKENFPEVSVQITSNFSTANAEKIMQLLSCGLDEINISLNAASPETYEKAMGLDYNTTVANINNLIELRNQTNSNLKIQLSMVLCDINKSEELKFYKLWYKKVDSIRLQRMAEWSGHIQLGLKSRYNLNKFQYPCKDLFERIPILSNGDYALCCQDSSGSTSLNITKTSILEAFSAPIYDNLRKIHLDGNIQNCSRCRKCFGVNSSGANWIFNPRDK